MNAFRDAVALRLDCHFDIRKQGVPILPRRQVAAQNLVHQLREIHRADVGNVISHVRDDELPTRGNHIVDRILVVVTQFLQSLNHHVVVGILRETKTDFSQFRPLFVYLQRRCLAHAQIDFRVNQLEVAACEQTKFGQLVEALASVLQSPAEHHALPVVPLLNADVKVAVLVERQEEVLQKVKRGFFGVNARVHVPLEVRVDVLVKPPDRVVVVPLQPQRIVEDAEHLKRLAEVGCAVARNAGQHLHHIAAVLLDRQALVAVAKVDDSINHTPAVFVRSLPHGEQT